MSDQTFTIGELAARCGVSVDAIRFYERERVLPVPRRTASRYRVYDDGDEGRVRFVREAQAIGLSLENVRELVGQERLETPGECRRVAELLRARLAEVDRKLAELRAFRRRLADNLSRCSGVGRGACPVILDLAKWRPRRRRAE